MKKRITLLSIIVAVLSFLNIGSVSAYNPSQFDLVPEPVYNLLRKILIEFGVGPGESFIVFAKFVLFVVLFALFFYGTNKFLKQPRIATVIALGISLFSVILLPGNYVLKMAELYAGVVGIALPVLLVWLGFRLYNNFEHPVMKGIIDALAIMITSFTVAAVQEGGDMPFLFETIKWFGLLQLFFMFMLIIHIFEAFSWAAGQMGETKGGGGSWFDKLFNRGGSSGADTPAARAAAGAERGLEGKEEAELESAQKLLALEDKLDKRAESQMRELEAEEYLQYEHLLKLLQIVSVLKQEARNLKYATDDNFMKEGFGKFRDVFNQFKNLLEKFLTNFEKGTKEFKSVISYLGSEFKIDKHLVREITDAEKDVLKLKKYMKKYNDLIKSEKVDVNSKAQVEIDQLFKAADELRSLLPNIKTIKVRLINSYENNIKVIAAHLKPLLKETKDLDGYLADLAARTYKTKRVGGVKILFGRLGAWDHAMNYLTMIEGHLKTSITNLKTTYEALDKTRKDLEKELLIFTDARKKVNAAFRAIPREQLKKIRP